MNTATPDIQHHIDDAIRSAVKGSGKVNIIISGKLALAKAH